MFKGYGAEDEEMYKNVVASGLKISYRDCWYQSLHHTRPIDPVLHKRNKELRDKGREPGEGLATLKYRIIEKIEFPLYTLLKVEL